MEMKFEKLVNLENFVGVMDGGDWNYYRFGFVEDEGKCYFVELEGSESDEDIFELKEGLKVGEIIEDGIERELLYMEEGDVYYEYDREEEVVEWIKSL